MNKDFAPPVESGHFDAAEFELVGKMILGDLPVTLLPGTWWSYIPSGNLVIYPQHLLTEWTAWRMVGAICHEAAEARYTGVGGSSEVAAWLRRAGRHALSAPSAHLLVNTVNDMRVNGLYLRRYPGSKGFLQALYADDPELHAKDDLRLPPGLDLDRYRPPHHAYVAALSLLWIDSIWPGSVKGPALASAVSQAVKQTWAQVIEAAGSDDVGGMLAKLENKVVEVYADLVHQWSPEELFDDESPAPGSESDSGPSNPLDEELPGENEPLSGVSGEGRRVSVGGGGVGASLKEIKALSKVTAQTVRMRAGARSGLVTRGAPSEAERRSIEPISAAAVQQLRNRADERIDYTKFDYLAAVKNLEDKIAETIDGDGRRPGLAELMDRRRHGASEALRRPRKHRYGDQGKVTIPPLSNRPLMMECTSG